MKKVQILCLFRAVFALLSSVDAMAVSRRRALSAGAAGAGWAIFGLTSRAPAADAAGARGAAELDFEYYMRDLVGGNKKEGNVLPSKALPMPPPRELKNPLRPLLLNDACSQDCLSTLALIEEVRFAMGPGREEDPKLLEREIQRSMNNYRDKAKNSFYARAPWVKESVSDQYYFDLTSYALWRTAADMLPNYRSRDKFVRRLGRFIYQNGVQAGFLKAKPLKEGSVVGTKECVEDIMDAFTSCGICKGYRLGEPVKKKEDERPLFDELDDEAISSGASVDCLVSVFEPATLGASLQITGEQSRFAPDFVGATLAAMWEKAGIQSSWETFFVDPEYRPNPKGTKSLCGLNCALIKEYTVLYSSGKYFAFFLHSDYFPNEQLLQYSLTLAPTASK